MTPRDTNFAKLVNAMWHGDNVWRDLDNQIRTMNKRLAVWRRAAKEYGISYEMTQRTAYEVLVTMQAIYGAVEKPLAAAPEAAPATGSSVISPPARISGVSLASLAFTVRGLPSRMMLRVISVSG